ncbi:MAG: OsmC family protein [Bacteroidota bacterium]
MENAQRLRAAFERTARALTLKPSVGQYTAVTKIRVRDGTTCEIEYGDWRFTSDIGKAQGGNDAGPGPGILERAALGSCLAIGYATWASVLDVPIEQIEVDIESEVDARGSFGVTDDPPGFRALRYRVHLQSSAPEADILRVLDEADAHSPVLDDFRRPLPIEREVRITAPMD